MSVPSETTLNGFKRLFKMLFKMFKALLRSGEDTEVARSTKTALQIDNVTNNLKDKGYVHKP